MTFRKLTQVVCLFLTIGSTLTDSDFTCPVSLSLNISSGTSNGSHIFADGLVYPPGLYFKQDNDVFGCVCNITRCIRKCCPPGKIFYRGACLQLNSAEGNFEVLVYAKEELLGLGNFTYLYNHECAGEYYRLAPEEFPDDITYIQADGLMYFPDVPISIEQHMFCVDNFLNDVNSTNSSVEFSGIVCFPEQPILNDELYSFGTYIYYKNSKRTTCEAIKLKSFVALDRFIRFINVINSYNGTMLNFDLNISLKKYFVRT